MQSSLEAGSLLGVKRLKVYGHPCDTADPHVVLELISQIIELHLYESI